jgi:queuine tRNA-ribosyltransferase
MNGADPLPRFRYELHATEGAARRGTLHTPHGPVETPVFMPVGTLGAVKTVSPDEVSALGASMILGNTYHLYLRPGHALVRELGGIHAFMRWDAPILTDSGGYQVFSLDGIRKIRDDGVEFQSHIDGSAHLFTPERAIEIQRVLGADVIMAFDECPPGGCDRRTAERANRRTLEWLERCRVRFEALEGEGLGGALAASPGVVAGPGGTAPDADAATQRGPVPPQALFPVLQGNVYPDLRVEHARAVRDMGDWVGYGIGGLSVGEAKEKMWQVLDVLDPELPRDRPRYLMGVGYPDDLLEAIARGCEMFDCVAPTRNARHGTAWTPDGQVNLKATRFRADRDPIDETCDCYACTRFDRAYLRHLAVSGEAFGHRLVSIHNLRFLVRLAEEARRRIPEGSFTGWADDWKRRFRGG